MKKLMLAAFIAAACSGCTNEGLRLPTFPIARKPVTQAQQQPKKPTISTQGIGARNQCWVSVAPSGDALVVSGGRTNDNRFFSCAIGGFIQIGPATPDFVGQVIGDVCDGSKPISQTPVSDVNTSIAHCIYRGPQQIPPAIWGLPIIVIR